LRKFSFGLNFNPTHTTQPYSPTNPLSTKNTQIKKTKTKKHTHNKTEQQVKQQIPFGRLSFKDLFMMPLNIRQ
jgi:hypothetical protein